MNKILFLFITVSTFFLYSCADNAFYISTQDMKHNYWKKGDTATFDVEITDTVACYNISAHLRSSDGYPWANIYMFTSMSDTTHIITTDTVMCILCDPSGRPTGHGLSNVKENAIPLWDGYIFPHTGKYTISISHGMRNIELPGINSISLYIEKTDISE